MKGWIPNGIIQFDKTSKHFRTLRIYSKHKGSIYDGNECVDLMNFEDK